MLIRGSPHLRATTPRHKILDSPQNYVDDDWSEHETEIVACLKVFDIAVSSYAYVPAGAELSSKEVQSLSLAADGKTNSEIATILSVHRRTVETHLANVRTKLDAPTTLRAALIAARQGQI